MARSMQATLSRRSRRMSHAFVPLVLLHCVAQSSPWASHVPSPLKVISPVLAYAFAMLVAAALPKRMPAEGVRRSVVFLVLMMAADLSGAHVAWSDGDHLQQAERLVLAAALACKASVVGLFIIDLVLTDGRRFWASLRLVLAACSGIWIAATLLLHYHRHRHRHYHHHHQPQQQEEEEQEEELAAAGERLYPPGLSFARALWYHLGCLLLATVGLSAPGRRRLSQWARLWRIAVPLADVAELPTVRLGRAPYGVEGGATSPRARVRDGGFSHEARSCSGGLSNSGSPAGGPSRPPTSPEPRSMSPDVLKASHAPLPAHSPGPGRPVPGQGPGPMPMPIPVLRPNAAVGGRMHRFVNRRITMYPEDFEAYFAARGQAEAAERAAAESLRAEAAAQARAAAQAERAVPPDRGGQGGASSPTEQYLSGAAPTHQVAGCGHSPQHAPQAGEDPAAARPQDRDAHTRRHDGTTTRAI